MAAVGRGGQPWEPFFDRTDASAASVSPNGRFIAYQSYHSGTYHVYVERFPELGDRRQVSTPQGGGGPVWSPDGRELFYKRVSDGAMMAVPVETAAAFTHRDPVELFGNKGWPAGPVPGGGGVRTWDVAPDGRFLMVKGDANYLPSRIVVVQNWTQELQRLVPVR
jgi:hypothetical protein